MQVDGVARPLRACEVYAAASALYGRPLLWHSVKEALSAYTIGGDRRFRSVGYGIYEHAPRRASWACHCCVVSAAGFGPASPAGH